MRLVLLCYKYCCLLSLPARGTCRLIWKEEMGVVRANIQTVEDLYQLIWTAIASKRPIEAVYKGLPRLFCPHRLGRNRRGRAAGAVLPVWWRKRKRTGSTRIAGKLALHCVGEVQPGKVTGGRVAHGPQSFPACILCDRS
jgi:hypothetical protein